MKNGSALLKLEPNTPAEERLPENLQGVNLVALLLARQEQTAVDEFSNLHAEETAHTQAKYYSKLLPAAPLKTGQQYAFEVDLDRCSGCKACVTACHSLNGLDNEEIWRDVGLLVGGSPSQPVMQHVTTACHHCIEPGCMHACPVNAYQKDPVTGIVKHLDDQCFGCQYCTLACPYDVPKYHHKKGIVRKCDMCADRLKVGEAPACVQACPHEAIAIRIVEVQRVIENAEVDHFLPGAPDPAQTLPTTTYKTSRIFPRNMLPADYYSVSPQHPHWPLIIMLVLTQLSVGAFTVGLLWEWFQSTTNSISFRQVHAGHALLFGMLALGASTLHLGRPLYAFRGILGLTHSWLSREILAFGVFAGCAQGYAALCVLSPENNTLIKLLGGLVAFSGIIGVYCSIMIYVFTRKEFWSFSQTSTKFLLSTAILGQVATLVSLVYVQWVNAEHVDVEFFSKFAATLTQGILISSLVKLAYEGMLFTHLLDRKVTSLKRSAMLMLGVLQRHTFIRFITGIIGGIILPVILIKGYPQAYADSMTYQGLVLSMFLLTIVGELTERYLFFSAVAAPRMPGSIRS